MEVINCVCQTYGSYHLDDLVALHHDFKEWTDEWYSPKRKSEAVSVPYKVLYRIIRAMSDSDANEAAAEVAYFHNLSDMAVRDAGTQPVN